MSAVVADTHAIIRYLHDPSQLSELAFNLPLVTKDKRIRAANIESIW